MPCVTLYVQAPERSTPKTPIDPTNSLLALAIRTKLNDFLERMHFTPVKKTLQVYWYAKVPEIGATVTFDTIPNDLTKSLWETSCWGTLYNKWLKSEESRRGFNPFGVYIKFEVTQESHSKPKVSNTPKTTSTKPPPTPHHKRVVQKRKSTK